MEFDVLARFLTVENAALTLLLSLAVLAIGWGSKVLSWTQEQLSAAHGRVDSLDDDVYVLRAKLEQCSASNRRCQLTAEAWRQQLLAAGLQPAAPITPFDWED